MAVVSKEVRPAPGMHTAPTDSAEISGDPSLLHLEAQPDSTDPKSANHSQELKPDYPSEDGGRYWLRFVPFIQPESMEDFNPV